MLKKLLPLTSIAFILCFFVTNNAKAQNISQTLKAGTDSVTIKVLPAEEFTGPNAMMTWDGGAKPDLLKSSPKPNHHLVVFLKRDGKPVEKAVVIIYYRRISPKKSKWIKLPVARMHVTGKGLETTHYGNNVVLWDGKYEARVKVDKNPTVIFRFTLSK